MKTIIAGGRDYNITDEDFKALDALDITEVVSGCARGADSGGEAWARSRGIPVKQFPANWNAHGKSAGMIRNGEMADYAQALAVFPGGKGTANMISRAKLKGLKIFTINAGVVNPEKPYTLPTYELF